MIKALIRSKQFIVTVTSTEHFRVALFVKRSRPSRFLILTWFWTAAVAMMAFLSIIGAIICSLFIVLVVGFIVFILKADGDITLLIYEKFGKKIEFSGQVVWITGASSGIGEFLAYDLAALDARLALSGTNIERLKEVKSNCLAHSDMKDDDVLLVPFNIEDFSIHDTCVKKVLDHFGHLDILVNNAGRSQRADFQDIEIEVDQKIFNINVFGAVNLTRKVLKHFLERNKGQIVVTSSTAGKMGVPNSSTYTGSKHALQGYFEALRTETIQSGISVTIVCPGPVYSGLTDRCFTGNLEKLADQKQMAGDKKMSTSRCCQLMVVAIANKLDECWISLQPILLVHYLAQYTPSFFKNIILKKFYSKERAKALRQGQPVVLGK